MDSLNINDHVLIKRLKKGDPLAFEEFVHQYQDRIYNLCRYMLRDARNAQDAAQDVFLKAYKGLKAFRPDSSLYTWIYRIAVTTCLDYQRKSRRESLRNEPLTENIPLDAPSPEQLYTAKEIRAYIQHALQKLPKKLSAVMVLREIEELSYEEIAEVLQISIGTVKSRIARAREQLRRILLKKIRADS